MVCCSFQFILAVNVHNRQIFTHLYMNIALNLTRPARPAAFVGYDMGGAVAAGFAAKYPNLCASLSLVSPLGIKYKPIQSEQWLQRKYFGEYMMMKQRRTLAAQQEGDFYDKSEDSPHRYCCYAFFSLSSSGFNYSTFVVYTVFLTLFFLYLY